MNGDCIIRPKRIGISSGIRPSFELDQQVDRIAPILRRLPARVRLARHRLPQGLPLGAALTRRRHAGLHACSIAGALGHQRDRGRCLRFALAFFRPAALVI